MPREREILLRAVLAHSFAADDIRLFLDTHPACAEAAAALDLRVAARRAAVKNYEAAYGPLTADGQNSACAHAWADGPWPWEEEG